MGEEKAVHLDDTAKEARRAKIRDWVIHILRVAILITLITTLFNQSNDKSIQAPSGPASDLQPSSSSPSPTNNLINKPSSRITRFYNAFYRSFVEIRHPPPQSSSASYPLAAELKASSPPYPPSLTSNSILDHNVLATLDRETEVPLLRQYYSVVKTHLKEEYRDYRALMAASSWGGVGKPYSSPFTIEDPTLLAAYLQVMFWPKDLLTSFPRGCVMFGGQPSDDDAEVSLSQLNDPISLDGATAATKNSALPPRKTCPAHNSLSHTLNFRALYKPFNVNPSLKIEGSVGTIYTRKYAHTTVDTKTTYMPIVWYRPGLAKAIDSEIYTRNLIYTLDRASALAGSFLPKDERDDERRYFVVLDCRGFGFGMIPTMAEIRFAFSLLNDHFPRRLGRLLIVNSSRSANVFWRLIQPLLLQTVRDKVTIISGSIQSMDLIQQYVNPKDIPSWLGGEDQWLFDGEEYYGKGVDWSDDEALAYRRYLYMHNL
jgi:hypothetical protein